MVEGLAARLSQQGGPPDDWARLIESYAMLGERDQANAVWNEAQAIFGGRPDDLAVVIEAAERAGVAQ
jgi:cytochrome c-type biogenesis protein CcmH